MSLRTGLVANCIRLTKRYNVMSSRRDVTCGLLGKSFAVLVWACFLTSRFLLFSRLRYSPSYYVHRGWIHFSKHGLKYPYLKHEHIELWIMHWRRDSHAWYLNIVLNRHTCMITSFLDKSIFVFKLKLMVACYNFIYQGFLKFLLCA